MRFTGGAGVGIAEVGVAKAAGGGTAWLAGLESSRCRLSRTSTAERVAAVLRGRIIEGSFAPGTRLSEEAIGAALGVSRNTLRESFRLLAHERLLVHEFNRGVFVRELPVADVIDLYRLRRIIECAAVRDLASAPDGILDAAATAVGDGERAAAGRQWAQVGTADLRFHQAIAGLAGSLRVDELMRGVLAELRLVFHVMVDPREFHLPYLARNRQILELLVAGDARAADDTLDRYLRDAEQQLVTAYRLAGGLPVRMARAGLASPI
jgi:DNA-binding GntR family transcriptional regulator